MILPRTLRRWLWRVDALLALGLAALAGNEVLAPSPAWNPPPAPKAVERSAAPLPPGLRRGEGDLQAMIRMGKRFFPPESPAPVPVQNTAEGPLPLGAYGIPLVVVNADGSAVVTLRSKVPSRPETHVLLVGVEEGGFLLESCRVEGRTAYAVVRRGRERMAYEASIPTGARDVIRDVPTGRSVEASPATFPGPVEARTGLPRIDVGEDVRAVPFYGADGKPAGARITGIRPGSALAVLGVKPGEVVRSVDASAVTSPADLRRLLASNAGVRGLEVESAKGGDRRRLGANAR